MSFIVAALLVHAAHSTPSSQPDVVTHPQIRCWTVEGTRAQSEEAGPTVTLFSTDRDEQPVRIEHNHDLILEGNEVEQSYNYLDYHFANEGRALMARTYLDEPFKVSIRFGVEVLPQDVDTARRLISGSVLCYLQKRFVTIEALTRDGYVQLWPEE